MKKVCFITTISTTLKSFVLDLAKYMVDNGNYDVTLICDYDLAFANSLPDGISYIPVDMKRGVNFSSFKSIKQFYKIFKENEFDIVQYATPNASFYASKAAKKAKVPERIYCQWGIRYVGFTGIKRFVFKCIEKIVCKKSTSIKCASFLNRDFAVKEKLYKKDKAIVIGQGGTIGVDLSLYQLNKKQEYREEIRNKHDLGNSFVYGFVGRLTKDKGCSELFNAFMDINKVYKDSKLLVVGPDEFGNELDEGLLNRVKKNKNIILTGKIDQKDMVKYYASLDCFVHPTYREGFGMVIQEAGAMQVPILTTRIIGAGEVMEENVSCLLCKPKSVSSLKEKMIQLLDVDYSKTLGEQARIRVEKYFDRDVMLKLQLDEFERVNA